MLELLIGVLVGVSFVLAAEAVAVFAFLARVLRKTNHGPAETPSVDREEETLPVLHDYSKKGTIWLLDPEKIPKITDDMKSKKKVIDVSPSRKFAKITDHSLSIMDPDGHQEEASVKLRDCTISSVSGSDLPSKKWAKRYPIKVEGKRSSIYRGSQVLYLFLETSMDKESWCKALRQASSEDTENRYAKLRKEFSIYVAALHTTENLSFLRPHESFADAAEKVLKVESPSKVKQLFKKVVKKVSKNGTKVGESSSLERGSSSLTESQSSSQSQIMASGNEVYTIDDGRGCWNLLFSRLFFDAQRSARLNNFIKERIQKSLSNMKTPNYIRGIVCTSLQLGNDPPLISAMRVLPMDDDLEWGFEADIEYRGGFSLEIETRLDAGESDFQEGILNSKNSDSDVTSALLGDLEEHEEFLNVARDSSSETKSDELNRRDLMARSKNTSWGALKYRSLVNTIASRVSQVQLSLSLKITSLRGNLRVIIKPPPSDQLWFAFTSMPELEWSIDASVGDYKLGSGHVTSLLGDRIRNNIQKTLVLPNSESVSISWMLAEKDDWVPRHVAPFLWIYRGSESNGGAQPDTTAALPPPLLRREPSADVLAPPIVKTDSPADTVAPATIEREFPASHAVTFSVEPVGGNSPSAEAPEPPAAASLPKTDRKTRMLDLRKKMSETLEVRRRQLGEKSRQIVEKMRENVDKRT